MSLSQTMQVFEAFDSGRASGQTVVDMFSRHPETDVTVTGISGAKGSTDFVRQDITPYGNGVYHINSILQPSIATTAPVVGVALCTESVVPGCGTGASHEIDIALAVKFAVEVAKEFTRGTCSFYDAAEYDRLIELYGSLAHLQRRAVAAGE
jgi:hypothetical protein